uniref:Uncharacterized protein n=1 Tax=Trypanosoma vivax (strain Y486) TaxID=1055687 RepID=G0TVM6_TRYVY|nr:hypothetical protein, unlikely [Trypanosoma vivax Y486]
MYIYTDVHDYNNHRFKGTFQPFSFFLSFLTLLFFFPLLFAVGCLFVFIFGININNISLLTIVWLRFVFDFPHSSLLAHNLHLNVPRDLFKAYGRYTCPFFRHLPIQQQAAKRPAAHQLQERSRSIDRPSQRTECC